MKLALQIFQIIVSVALVAAILLQQKGVGLGAAFGGSSNIYSTKRGVDKVLFRATIVLAVLFFATAVANIIVK